MALEGIKVIEMAGLAPDTFCGMILADFGAKVTRIDRVSGSMIIPDTLARGKQSVAMNLKKPEGVAAVRKLCSSADVLIEPFRPGLGLSMSEMPQTGDPAEMAKTFKSIFLTETRDEWDEVFKDLDACYAPVLEMDEAATHADNAEKGTFIQNPYRAMEPAPAPGLSRTPGVTSVTDQPEVGDHTMAELISVGYYHVEVQTLIDAGVAYQVPD